MFGYASSAAVTAPVSASQFDGATQLYVGADFVCAFQSGRMLCAGEDSSGQLGDGAWTASATLKNVFGLSGVTFASAAAWSACALVSTELKCWGLNAAGEVGDGTTTSRNVATAVQW
jgi:hypothetical protein